MTRTEEIIKAADEASDEEEHLDGWEKNRCWEYFIQGAEWADETMFEKVCKWIKENIDHYIGYHFDESDTYLDDKFFEDFRKAKMEGII